MTSGAAWRRGFGVLGRHPWLALIPMLWDLVQAGLAWLGVPLGPVAGPSRLAEPMLRSLSGQPAVTAVQLWGFLPTPLPGVGNLTVSLQPAILEQPFTAGTWAALASTLLVPGVEAVLTAIFLSLIGAYVAGSAGWRWRNALERVPALFVLMMAGRLGVIFLPMPLLIGLGVAYVLFLPLLPYVLGAGRPLGKALREAPGILWGNLGDWFGLGLRTLLATAVLTFLWSLAGQPLWLAELIYPFVGTGIVAAAVALCLRSDEAAAPEPEGSWAFLGSLLAAGVAAAALTSLTGSWAGWYPTRETALQPPAQAPSLPMFGTPDKPAIRYTWPESTGTQLVIYEVGGRDRLQLGRLKQGRFGWKALEGDAGGLFGNPESPANVGLAFLRPAGDRGLTPRQRYVWGEITDSRVAFVDLKGQRVAIGRDGPLFVVPIGPEEGPSGWGLQDFVLLDAAGQPVPERGTAR